MEWSIVILLYFIIITTTSMTKFHCRPAVTPPINYIHALKTKWTFISIEMNIVLRFSKPVYIIGWWNVTDSFMNENICILECLTYIQNTGSESMHICNSNVDSEGVIMCHWIVGRIKVNTLNLRTPICTVECNKFSWIRTVAFLNNCINERM